MLKSNFWFLIRCFKTYFNGFFLFFRFLEKIDSDHALMTKNIEKYLSNPLNSFSLIKRLSNDIEKLRDNFKFVDEFFQQ